MNFSYAENEIHLLTEGETCVGRFCEWKNGCELADIMSKNPNIY